MRKRLISCLLSLALICSLLPANVLAEELRDEPIPTAEEVLPETEEPKAPMKTEESETPAEPETPLSASAVQDSGEGTLAEEEPDPEAFAAEIVRDAGRRSDGGEVVIQTSEPGHPVIRQVAAGDFEGMARAQLAERKAFFYPPYARLTSLTLRHRDPSVLRNGVMDLAARLRTRFGRRLLGPMTPPVDRIRGEYLVGLLLKIESGASSARARELLAAELKTFAGNPAFKSITVVVNVDPQ